MLKFLTYDMMCIHTNNATPPIPSDHKLCGYLTTLLTSSPNSQTLEFGDILHLFTHSNGVVGFKSPSSGHFLSPPSTSAATTPKSSAKSKGKKKKKASGGGILRNNLIGGFNSAAVVPVVHQIKTLVNQKCVSVAATVVRVSDVKGKDGEREREVRVVVLVDVYLPVAVWCERWQFPRSGTTAASLFRHLSCDWQERASILKIGHCKDIEDREGMWNLPDCHVLGCERHSNISDSSKKKGFDLHEIFKSLPSLAAETKSFSSSITPNEMADGSGIWDLSDDILFKILATLNAWDLKRVSMTCRHLRVLSASIMPCIKLKLFSHQQAAVEWMVQRERNAATLNHPLYLAFVTEDGFAFYVNIVSGELVTELAPTTRDFRGGLFCDEPGLGKTVTALSLILKTKGTLADPPVGAEIIWCSNNEGQKCGHYECSGSRYSGLAVPSPGQKCEIQSDRRGQFSPDELIPKDHLTPTKPILSSLGKQGPPSTYSCPARLSVPSPELSQSTPAPSVVRCTRSLSRVKKNLVDKIEGTSGYTEDIRPKRNSSKRKHASHHVTSVDLDEQFGTSFGSPRASKRQKAESKDRYVVYDETWIQCDDCGKWRKLSGGDVVDSRAAWFCSLNSDPQYQSCIAPEEKFDVQPLTYFPGYCSKDTPGELPQNVAFFISVLKEHRTLLNCQTRKALRWLARLPSLKLSEMETVGLGCPGQVTTKEASGYQRLFGAFGLIKRSEQGTVRWSYPKGLDNLVFDLPALRTALCEPLDSYRMYLSRATLVVVPSNLVDHWKTQIEKHVKPGQLKVYAWDDYKKPSAHNLAWDYDLVITTFTRLSAEWNPHRRSVLMQVHWMRVILDEGHTLGSSINLTNKMQMAVSLCASNRWILTGTPTPHTPTSQVSHLQPMLKFLHDEVYGESPKNWEIGILKPFEAEMEEGKLRLLALLKRSMISARKADLACIPPCIKKTAYVNFTEAHAKTYNELVVTVRRNILMADWNDPSHVESLLNPKQWKFRTATIKNVRLSCCVAGHIKIQETEHDIQETMDILVQNGLDPLSQEYAVIRYNLSYGGNCLRCGEWCRLPIITPCRHLLCLDCVALDSERCALPGCGFQYEMQSPDILTRPENPNPKWPVPKDLIELQPSYKQDDWDPDWQSTSSSKVAYLVQRLKEIQAASRQIDCPMGEENCSERPSNDLPDALVEKVLIFSQFLEHIHVIAQQLTFADIKFVGMYSPMNASNKKKSLTIFQRDPSCMALVMDGTAALGLDLSFVTYVFLMEPIWDKSMEEQVISRAHRMGAVRPIHVETLAMRGTIEEQMLEFLQNANECRRLLKEDHENKENEGTRAHRSLHEFAEKNYLARLSMVRTKA